MPIPQGGLQAHVRHRRGHDQVARQLGLGLHIPRRHQHHSVAIDDPALGVGEKSPVRIPVEGDSQVGTPVPWLP